MDEREKLELYSQLEQWAVALARRMASGPLARWADDIEQEARVALWQAIQSYDRSKNDGVDCYVRWKTVMLLRNALDRYGRWESREFPTDELIDISFCPKQNERFI